MTVKIKNKNRKKGDDSKTEDKDNNTTGTAGAYVGEVTTPEDSTVGIQTAALLVTL